MVEPFGNAQYKLSVWVVCIIFRHSERSGGDLAVLVWVDMRLTGTIVMPKAESSGDIFIYLPCLYLLCSSCHSRLLTRWLMIIHSIRTVCVVLSRLEINPQASALSKSV
jgi:hypothetical protein